MKVPYIITMTLGLLNLPSAYAQEHRVEVLRESPPADTLPEAIVQRLASTGLVIKRGSDRTVCQFWPCQQWQVDADFSPDGEVNYPFQSGQLVGVMCFQRRGRDFRDERIARNVYTMRYGRQPVDGNHEGTFPTRDFLVLVRAQDEHSANPVDVETLIERSQAGLELGHPGLVCLLAPSNHAGQPPSMVHDTKNDWWILQFEGETVAGGQRGTLRVNMVISGHAQE